MTATPSPLRWSGVVDRLRAAGCVFAEDEATLLLAEATTPDQLAAMVDARVSGLPLEQVLGWAEFCGMRVGLLPDVFVPRRRTELLVREAAALAPTLRRPAGPGDGPPLVVVDLCCGSGAVGLALSARLTDLALYAVDIEDTAVRCARRNLGGAAEVLVGDLFDPLPPDLRGRVDLAVANAPYVPTGSVPLMPPEARAHEPLVTLDGGADGLDVQRRIVAEAPTWLARHGHLLVESSRRQAPRLAEVFRAHGLEPRVVTADDLGGTVVAGRLRER